MSDEGFILSVCVPVPTTVVPSADKTAFAAFSHVQPAKSAPLVPATLLEFAQAMHGVPNEGGI